ncbi:DNA ligase D [Achromobacter kerstersii]|uniref:DNA ligase (ATP) n=1 Tax=Achromobacter kerstersii TaxID=1353890 RepID=A0A6S7AT25_9BURK|nr:DNA ligase D [Achromobacter kerstersii]CAB3743607.1 Multifunctional non-homologous end joining protein LigD [Achromobacter kerstersii]
MSDSLKKYREKRNFAVTSEPAEGGLANEAARAFVIQKHWASRLHYDLRLELDGAMKSWAVPKGPSYDPTVKRMAVQVEDHPIAYNEFEGDIPKGEYGAGKVIIWDEGVWTPVGDPRRGYKSGHLKFDLEGSKMHGRWALVRLHGKEDEKQPPWLLIKDRDAFARGSHEFSVVDELPDSVVPLRKKKKRTAKQAPRKDPPTASTLPGQETDMPGSLKPQLATLVDGIPRGGDDWLYEVKFDGYRMLARIDGPNVKLFTRNGHDWSAKMPHLVQALRGLPAQSAWIDGEIVVLADNGVPSFQALQNAFDGKRTKDIVFYAFDLPYIAGRDIRSEPLRLRRDLLAQLIAASKDDRIRFSEAFNASPSDLIASACRMGLEGIMGKRQSAPYVSRRTDDWVKIKCAQRQEFIIVGYTAPKGGRVGFGALLLGVHDEPRGIRYAGSVGTGFDDRGLAELHKKLMALVQKASPLTVGKPKSARDVRWVKPTLVCEVSFGEWTEGGHVRHATFRGLRTDKPPQSITREVPLPAGAVEAHATAEEATDELKPRGAGSRPKPGKLSNPDRVIDPSTGLTKLDLARYYGLVAPLLLAHLKDRPVSFVRAPSGIQGQLFFQKHLDAAIPGVTALPEKLHPGHPALLEVPTQEAIMSAAQMNVVEFHTWNAVKSAIGKPDRLILDLDPGEGVTWQAVQQGAQLVRVLLDGIGLAGWLKTSGGKGLHVVIPVRRQYDWDTVKGFSETVVRHLARTLPQIFVAKSGPKNRVGKIFVDYLRNGFGATTASAWSARARPGLGVSVPLAWDELPKVTGGAQWTIANIHNRLDVANSPWDDYLPQSLGKAMKAIGYERR